MVTRKPVPQPADSGLAPKAPSPPYPVTPISTDTNANPQFHMQDVHNQMSTETPDTEPNSATNAWSGEGFEKQNHGMDTHSKSDIPESLRVGPRGGTPRTSQEMQNPNLSTTNPYLQKQQTELTDGKESSASAWGGSAERPPQPAGAPPPPPVPQGTKHAVERVTITNILVDAAPSQQFSDLSISEPSTNPWQPALDQKALAHTPPMPPTQRQDSGNEVWSDAPGRQAPNTPASFENSQHGILIDTPEPESPAWDEDEASPVIAEMPANNVQDDKQMHDDRHAWDEHEGHGVAGNGASSSLIVPQEDTTQQNEGWNIVDHESAPSGHQQSGVIGADGTVLEIFPSRESEHAPALPPRRSEEHPPPQPPRPVIDANNRSTSSIVSPAAAAARTQKKETYEIKKITWHDVTAAEKPRVSPILVQNANGPCPLLALVNALTLSTPANVETALVETLRSREQVSLGLLLDAVFDELMSGRRGDAAQELPDVSDLYSFLITLHTGMNVNPRFFPNAPTKSSNDPRNSMSHVHPAEREAALPGTFEDTREMKLYSTFSIPLIHGWLPERDSPAFAALSRTAKSYEDAQNIFFHEEELEEKLQIEGLSFEEQATLEDIATIKAFFATNATQLTPFGLETITTSLAPGAVAILFRNDHFSTLYRHPDTLQLLQLVTDMGYAGHEEVVWESLIDVNGENAEFFSGDFRLVGGAPASPTTSNPASHPSGDGWTTVTGRRTAPNQNQQQSHGQRLSLNTSSNPVAESPRSPNIEQEDHDLALALQLQEEEEERHRNEIARRRRETELSQQYIEQQGGHGGNIPVSQRGGQGRGSGPRSQPIRGGGADLRPAIPPRRSGQPATSRPDLEAGVDAPPPSYEQAAHQAAYVPPSDHPAHPSASPISGHGRRQSAYSANQQNVQGAPPQGRMGRRGTGNGPTLVEQIPSRRSTGPGLSQQQQDERSKDCTVM